MNPELTFTLNDILTAGEAEMEYGIRPGTIRQDIRRERLDPNHYRKSGRDWLISRHEVEKVYKR